MHLTDTEIKDFEQIAKRYTSELIDLERVHDWLHEAESELAKSQSDVRVWQKQIEYCKQRINRMERFEIWLEINHGI